MIELFELQDTKNPCVIIWQNGARHAYDEDGNFGVLMRRGRLPNWCANFPRYKETTVFKRVK